MTRITTCPDPETVAERAAAHVARELARARGQRGVAHLALSGGGTPARTYELLASMPDAVRDSEIWFADERCVAPDDELSNYRLARETLLEPARIPAARIHRMYGECGPDEGASRYAQELAARLDGSPGGAEATLDLVILGIGPDGHVASLFPGAETLRAGEHELCLAVHESPKPPPQRITLSLEVLRAARECVLLATGASKADAISAMLGEPSRHVPASLLRRERLTVMLDDAAAPPRAL